MEMAQKEIKRNTSVILSGRIVFAKISDHTTNYIISTKNGKYMNFPSILMFQKNENFQVGDWITVTGHIESKLESEEWAKRNHRKYSQTIIGDQVVAADEYTNMNKFHISGTVYSIINMEKCVLYLITDGRHHFVSARQYLKPETKIYEIGDAIDAYGTVQSLYTTKDVSDDTQTRTKREAYIIRNITKTMPMENENILES